MDEQTRARTSLCHMPNYLTVLRTAIYAVAQCVLYYIPTYIIYSTYFDLKSEDSDGYCG